MKTDKRGREWKEEDQYRCCWSLLPTPANSSSPSSWKTLGNGAGAGLGRLGDSERRGPGLPITLCVEIIYSALITARCDQHWGCPKPLLQHVSAVEGPISGLALPRILRRSKSLRTPQGQTFWQCQVSLIFSHLLISLDDLPHCLEHQLSMLIILNMFIKY